MKNTKEPKAAIKVPTFKDFCKKNISSYDFDRLDKATSLTKHMITKMLNNPEKMTLKILLVIAEMLHLSPIELIGTYNCGLDVITAREYRSLLDTITEKKEN